MSDPAPGSSRGLVVALMVIYLVLLGWLILWKFDVPYVGAAARFPRPIKLIPFAASAGAGASSPWEVLANIALFVPFGLYLGLLAPAWRWWKAASVFAAASLALEITQHLISTGSFDITDVITNAAGGLLGFGLLALARRRLGTRATAVMARVMAVFTVIFLVATGVFLASPLHYAPRHDVVVPSPTASA